MDNSDVNTTERQFISGSYNVRGGQSQIGVDDGSFYSLELANSQGVVYLIGTGNIADVRNNVDFHAGTVVNNLITHDVGLTGAITYPANGSSYDAVFGMMNNTPGIGNFMNNTISTNGNISSVDEGYIIGNLRRSISATGGNYGFVVGLEPAGANMMRGVQYTRLDVGANNYDVITGFFESQSPNNAPSALDCSGNTMNYFGGSDHGEWMFSDLNGSGAGAYSVVVWPQDDNFMVSSPWLVTKDNLIQGTTDECGPTPVGLSRGGFNGFSSPSEFDVASTLTPLPATLLKIWAESHSSFIQVNWEVASEVNLDYYELERSRTEDGFNYLSIIPLNVSETDVINYSYDDYDVNRNQVYYYRYKAVDLDGSIEYSPVVSGRLHDSGSDGDIQVYPNPIENTVQVSLNLSKSQSMNVEIVNSIGKVIYQTEEMLEKGNSVLSIDCSSWSAGVYFVKVSNRESEEISWKKIVKK